MLSLYNTALLPLRLAAEGWAAFPTRDESTRLERTERLGRRSLAIASGAVWLHGASVGEARIVSALGAALRAARPGLPLAVSAVTPAGRALLPRPPAVEEAFYLPLDFPGVVRRVLAGLRPAALALVETELWPNLLREASRAGVPVVLLNARLAARRMARYRLWSGLYAPLLATIQRIGAQSSDDAARFVEVGALPERVEVTGNVKYDLPLPKVSADALRARLALSADRPVFVAGSTAAEEIEPVLRAFALARRGRPDLLLVLAPRHLERVEAAIAAVRASDLRLARLSLGEDAGNRDVVLVDTLGELAAQYQLATGAFVGGSLVPIGDHNVLEPAAVGVPVLFGPHLDHVREPATALEASGGGFRVGGGEELATRLVELLEHPALRAVASDSARHLVASNRGALARSVNIVLASVRGASS